MKERFKNIINNRRGKIKTSLKSEIRLYFMVMITISILAVSLTGFFTTKYVVNMYAPSDTNITLILGLIIFGVSALSLFLVLFIIGKVLKKVFETISLLSNVSIEIANGNFDVELSSSKFENELGSLINNLILMKHNTKEMIGSIRDTTLKVKDITGGVQEALIQNTMGSEHLATSTVNFSGKVDETSANAEKIQESTIALGSNINEIKNLSDIISNENSVAKEEIALSEEKLNNSIHAMNDVLNKSDELAIETDSLVTAFDSIYNIINTINYIAEQTQMLSLNAEIESAKAGEYGKPFSVVANRIKDLAMECKASVADTQSIVAKNSTELKNMQKIIIENKGSVKNGMDSLNEGIISFKHLAENVKNNIENTNEITAMINISNDSIEEVSNAITASTENIRSLTDEISNISALSEEQLAVTEQLYTSFEEVNIEQENLINEIEKISK